MSQCQQKSFITVVLNSINFYSYLLNDFLCVFLCVKMMATAIRSTGCCAIANTANLRQTQNSTKQDRWERLSSTRCITGAMLGPFVTGLTSDLFGNKSFMPKNGRRRNFRVGRVSPIRSKMFVPGTGKPQLSTSSKT